MAYARDSRVMRMIPSCPSHRIHEFDSPLAVQQAGDVVLSQEKVSARGDPKITLEQVAQGAAVIVWKIWQRSWAAFANLIERANYWQRRNEASYRSRRGATIADSS